MEEWQWDQWKEEGKPKKVEIEEPVPAPAPVPEDTPDIASTVSTTRPLSDAITVIYPPKTPDPVLSLATAPDGETGHIAASPVSASVMPTTGVSVNERDVVSGPTPTQTVLSVEVNALSKAPAQSDASSLPMSSLSSVPAG